MMGLFKKDYDKKIEKIKSKKKRQEEREIRRRRTNENVSLTMFDKELGAVHKRINGLAGSMEESLTGYADLLKKFDVSAKALDDGLSKIIKIREKQMGDIKLQLQEGFGKAIDELDTFFNNVVNNGKRIDELNLRTDDRFSNWEGIFSQIGGDVRVAIESFKRDYTTPKPEYPDEWQEYGREIWTIEQEIRQLGERKEKVYSRQIRGIIKEVRPHLTETAVYSEAPSIMKGLIKKDDRWSKVRNGVYKYDGGEANRHIMQVTAHPKKDLSEKMDGVEIRTDIEKCGFEGCNELATVRGHCRKHYNYLYTHGKIKLKLKVKNKTTRRREMVVKQFKKFKKECLEETKNMNEIVLSRVIFEVYKKWCKDNKLDMKVSTVHVMGYLISTKTSAKRWGVDKSRGVWRALKLKPTGVERCKATNCNMVVFEDTEWCKGHLKKRADLRDLEENIRGELIDHKSRGEEAREKRKGGLPGYSDR